MINSNKRWLLTASPWMKNSRGLTLGIKTVFMCALLVFAGQIGKAQTHTYGYFGWGSGGIPSLPVINGNTTICIGTTTTLSDATPGGVWSSANTAIATVNSSTGLVTGVSGGVVGIAYSFGGISIGTTITVTYPITGGSNVCVGNNIFLTDTTATGAWSSSNPLVAKVLATGEVDGISAGTATITYGRPGSCAVTQVVTASANGVAPIAGTGALSICLGGSMTAIDPTPLGTWGISNNAIASINVSTGLINSLSAGGATITYTSGGCFVTKPLIVTAASSLSPITGASAVCIGNTTQLSEATAMGAWSSSNPSVAYINTAGTVTGKSAGTATITYSKTGCSVTKLISVNANTVGAITGSANLCIGQTTALSDTTAGGVWSSSDITLATVAGGVVTGVAAGSPYITYSVVSTGCSQTMAVVVNPATSVGAFSGINSICQGSTTKLANTVLGGTWSSGSPSVASVNSFGTVTGVTSGSATITYTRLGCAALDTVTVNPLPAAITGVRRECAVNINTTTALSDATGGGAWSSSNTAFATINSGTGLVTGVAPGVVTISYTLPSGCYVTTTDTTYGPPAITGGNLACIAPLTYLVLSEPAILGGTWSSLNTNASVSGTGSTGAVTGLIPGLDSIKYTVKYSGMSCYVAQPITIASAPGLISGSFSTCIGGATTLTDTATAGIWSSANTAIATVGSASGIVSGVAAGASVITYSKNGCFKTANVTVGTPPSAITGSSSLCNKYASIYLVDTTLGGTWSASNGYVSIARNGLSDSLRVTGLTAGTTTISYTIGGCSVTKVETINSSNVTAIAGPQTICTGLSITLTDATSGGVWSSGNTGVAVIVGPTNTTAAVVQAVKDSVVVITYTRTSDGCFVSVVLNTFKQPGLIKGAYSVCNGLTTTLSDSLTGGVWSVGDAHIATVNSGGLVTGITAGHTTVTYSLFGGCQAYQPMSILPMPNAIGGATAMCLGGPTTTMVDSLTGGKWFSSSTAVATIDSTAGVVTSVAAGTSTLTYTLNGCVVTKAFTVGSVTPTFVAGPVTTCAMGYPDTAVVVSIKGGAWTGSNNLVATVAAYGSTYPKVTGISPGTVTLTYTLNGCYATQTETVTPNSMPAIIGAGALCAGNAATFSDATTGGIWTSANTLVATVGSLSGTVNAVAAGSVVLTYGVMNGGCMQFISVNVGNVTPVPFTGNVPVCMGGSFTVSDATAGGDWNVDNNTVAYVNSSGVVVGVNAGTANISYTLTGCSATQVVTVNPLPVAIVGNAVVCEGNIIALTDTTSGGTWSSSTPAKGSVDASGNVTGIAFGTTTIKYTITLTGCLTSTVVTVGGASPVLGGPTHLCNGTSITITTTKSGGVWLSGNPSIASVSGGVVSGVYGGIDTIFYTNPGCPAVYYLDTVNYVAPVTGSSTLCKKDSMFCGDVTLSGTWSSSNTTLATVTSAGQVFGVGVGNAGISYTVGGCSSVLPVTLIDCGYKIGQQTAGNTEEQVYTLFPNPGNGNITISQGNPVDGSMQVSVINYVGEKVYAGAVEFAGGKCQLNISAASGMYMLLLQDKKGVTKTFKVLIEK